MNFIAATVELESIQPDSITDYGLTYRAADAFIPSGNSNGQTRFRVLCYDNPGPKLSAFLDWKPGKRVLITGKLMFSDNAAAPLDLIVGTMEPNTPEDMCVNQLVLGNAFFGDDQIKDRKNKQIAVKIGTTLDNSNITTWLYMESNESLKAKLSKRIRKGRALCVQGYLREYRKDNSDSPYRAIVASDFSTRQELTTSKRGSPENSSATGYTEVDPTPDFY